MCICSELQVICTVSCTDSPLLLKLCGCIEACVQIIWHNKLDETYVSGWNCSIISQRKGFSWCLNSLACDKAFAAIKAILGGPTTLYDSSCCKPPTDAKKQTQASTNVWYHNTYCRAWLPSQSGTARGMKTEVVQDDKLCLKEPTRPRALSTSGDTPAIQ